MTQIADIVVVNVNIADTVLSRAGFGTALILADVESSVFTARTKIYNNITEIAADFDTSLDVYLAADAFFSISPRPPSLKVGRQESGDSDVTDALTSIVAEDDDWYCLLMTNHAEADVLEANDFIGSRSKIFLAESQQSALLSAGSTASITGITRVAQVATAVAAGAHSLSNGDLVTISGANQTEYNGTFIISNITSTDFDFTVTGSPTTPATGTILWAPGQVDELWNTSGENRTSMMWQHLADSEFPASAWAARQLNKDPGASTWNLKQLTGITGSTVANLTTAQEAYLLAKGSNVYTFIGATGVAATREGTMASGRFIDVQRSQDWLSARIGEEVLTLLLNEPKVPYTDAGAGLIESAIIRVVQQAIGFGMLGPLLTADDGAFWDIFVPKVASQSSSDRANRDFPGITVAVQLAGAIHSTTITVNVSV